ncbi:type ISP restriction/modification enzyme [Sulfitobacter sp. M13]
MVSLTASDVENVSNFEQLVELLRDHLEWPIGEDYGFDDIVFEYEADELGLKKDEVAKIREIHQLRPLATNQPWGIFFISMEDKVIPVTVLRRILKALVVKKRAGAQSSERRAWDKSDLIFAASFGQSGARELAFVHFSDGKSTGDLPVMKVLGWNAQDTKLHNEHAAKLLREKLIWPDDAEDTESWRETWASAFELRLNEAIRTSKDLALQLAELASDIRARVNQLLKAEEETGPMRTMLSAFRKNLIHDLDDDGFADMFAQTISYGMLAARISRPEGIIADNLADMVPKTNPFLKELFANFLKIGGRDKRSSMDFDELGVRDVVDMLNAANMEAVLRDFGDRNPKEDPVIHFYELFLKEYDPQKRMQRGVFYTPRPVVNFIVRGVDEILRNEFSLPLGLADTSTWAEVAARNDRITLPDHVQPNAPFVQILDPATGTGTFLVEVIDLIYNRMCEHWKSEGMSGAEVNDAWNAYVPAHLLPRLTAFELMMAPYTIAHMKVGLKLSETGYAFGSDERARIFLTNALEPERDLDMEFDFMSEALAHEAHAANQAKVHPRFTIVLGNPPYSRESKNLTNAQKQLVQNFKLIEGTPVVKRGHLELERAVQNDYVKFIALMHQKILQAGAGVSGLITSNSFLEAPLLSGLRYHWKKDFSISIVDLHGYSQGQANDSLGDENVFDILEGVAVHFGTRLGKTESRKTHIDGIKGSREEKFERLISAELLRGEEIFPKAPNYLFAIETSSERNTYESWGYLESIMPLIRGAIVTARDKFVIGYEANEVVERIIEFRDSDESLERRSVKLGARWSGSWANEGKASSALSSVRGMEDRRIAGSVSKLAYRPFDTRHLFYMDNFLDTPARAVMASMLQPQALGLSLGKSTRNPSPEHFLAVDHPVEAKCAESTKQCHLAPLWLSPSNGEDHLRPNIDRRVAKKFGETVNLSYEDGLPRGAQSSLGPDFQKLRAEQLGLLDVQWDGRGDLNTTFGPRDLFDYIYAVLHSPGYRSRYAEFLRSDFPRIPTPKNRTTFADLVQIGHDLVDLHLLRSEETPGLETPNIRFAGTGEARVEKSYPKFENGKIMINGFRWFEDVPKATWEFHVGGYQVCHKWLKDRAGKGGKNPHPGRILSDDDILHYRRVVVALTDTQRLMDEVDAAIEKHGGWPGAFYQSPPPPPSVEDIIVADESRDLEFKSTFQWDMREGKQNKLLQKQVLKTLAAFMNADGGTLVIGVTDDKEIIGLEHDLKLVKDSLDAFENRLLSVFSSAIGAPYTLHCKMRFADVRDEKIVCVIDVLAAKEPVFVDFQSQHEFFIRRGNATVSLNASEQHTYIRQRFAS